MHKMQHLTGKELDLLRYFYEKHKGYVRQIKKSVTLSEHTLLKYLTLLEKQGMITSTKEGNLKIYNTNIENNFIKVFFSYFDLMKLESLEYKRNKAIKILTSALKNLKMPHFVLLFGSTAKGNYTHKSDIDVIIVYDYADKAINESVDIIKKKVLAETGLKINSIIMKIDEFLKEKQNKQNYALQDAINTGYPIFGNQSYYEAAE